MNPERMYDSGSAIIAATVHNVHSKEPRKPADYMPYRIDKPQDEPTIDEFLKALGPGVKIGKRR